MRRLAHRLRPRWPRPLAIGGAGLLTAFWLGMALYAAYDPALKPHQRQITLLLCGALGMACVAGLARLLASSGGETVVEVDANPAAPGRNLRVFVLQRGRRRLQARLLCLHRRGRVEEPAVDLPLGSADPEGLRAQFETSVRLPTDAPPTAYDTVRWCIEVRTSIEGAPARVEQFALLVA